jgi:hypothetical protein
MTQKIYMVITNNGDGSNGIQILQTERALAHLDNLAEQGYETYASGEGLQYYELCFPDEFALGAWVNMNFMGYDDQTVLDPEFEVF